MFGMRKTCSSLLTLCILVLGGQTEALASGTAVTRNANPTWQKAGGRQVLRLARIKPGASVFHTEEIQVEAFPAVRTVEFRLDGRMLSSDVVAPFNYVWDTRSVDDGPHRLVIRGISNDGSEVGMVRRPVYVFNESSSVQRVREDYKRGLINKDQRVRRGIEAVLRRDLLPPRYSSPVEEPGDFRRTLFEFVEDLDEVRADTVQAVEEMPISSPSFRKNARIYGFPNSKGKHAGRILERDGFQISFVDAAENPNHPDALSADVVEQILFSLKHAYSVYTDELQYEPPPGPIKIEMIEPACESWDFAGECPAWASPLGDHVIQIDPHLETVGALESRYYLPRHELFHVFQYQYVDGADFAAHADPNTWWLEASAEWASHQSNFPQAAPDAAQIENGDYAGNLATVFKYPDSRLITRLSNAAYGSFIFAEYLEEKLSTSSVPDPTVIRETWERMGSADHPPADQAIEDVVTQRGQTLPDVVRGFWEANYRLKYAYADDEARSLWPLILDDAELTGHRPTHSSHHIDILGTSAGTASLGSGGAYFGEIYPSGDSEGLLKVRVEAEGGFDDVDVRLWSFTENFPATCSAPVTADGSGTVATAEVFLEGDCRFATLIVTYSNPRGPYLGADAYREIQWSASLEPSYGRHVLEDNPAGYWRLGELQFELEATDASGNGNHGSYLNYGQLYRNC